MEPRWITAFVDQPVASFDVGSRFWATVTGSTISPRRGRAGEFATLVPVSGDPFCRVQATEAGGARVHLDFHVDSIDASVAEAQALGARVLEDLGHVLMASPAGLPFCVVAHHGEHIVPPAIGDPPSALDQVSVDVAPADFDGELEFWSRLLGWPRRILTRREFQRLDEPPGRALQLLFQRLEEAAPDARASAHLDLAAGEGREAVAAWHESIGAERLATFDYWIVMRDPVGLEYCVTAREPGAIRA